MRWFNRLMWSGWYAPVGDAEFGENASAG
jgi:hypothetical protein